MLNFSFLSFWFVFWYSWTYIKYMTTYEDKSQLFWFHYWLIKKIAWYFFSESACSEMQTIRIEKILSLSTIGWKLTEKLYNLQICVNWLPSSNTLQNDITLFSLPIHADLLVWFFDDSQLTYWIIWSFLILQLECYQHFHQEKSSLEITG